MSQETIRPTKQDIHDEAPFGFHSTMNPDWAKEVSDEQMKQLLAEMREVKLQLAASEERRAAEARERAALEETIRRGGSGAAPPPVKIWGPIPSLRNGAAAHPTAVAVFLDQVREVGAASHWEEADYLLYGKGNESLRDYADRIQRLHRRSLPKGDNENERRALAKEAERDSQAAFLRGLRHEAFTLMVTDMATERLDPTIQRALELEARWMRARSEKEGQVLALQEEDVTDPTVAALPGRYVPCPYQPQPRSGNPTRGLGAPPAASTEPSGRAATNPCERCQQGGHHARDCTAPAPVRSVTWDESPKAKGTGKAQSPAPRHGEESDEDLEARPEEPCQVTATPLPGEEDLESEEEGAGPGASEQRNPGGRGAQGIASHPGQTTARSLAWDYKWPSLPAPTIPSSTPGAEIGSGPRAEAQETPGLSPVEATTHWSAETEAPLEMPSSLETTPEGLHSSDVPMSGTSGTPVTPPTPYWEWDPRALGPTPTSGEPSPQQEGPRPGGPPVEMWPHRYPPGTGHGPRIRKKASASNTRGDTEIRIDEALETLRAQDTPSWGLPVGVAAGSVALLLVSASVVLWTIWRTRQHRNPGEATTTPQTQISLDLRQGDAPAPPPQASKETGSGVPRFE
ncbi:hypothetical protein GE061_005056 [Apolygus lucorum]|uniref:CCHC-type domain-containing protein n=1 Tax=Apolygus lucorum TaxID=248454 RepID=A0A8S9WV78_APOLU|nr:hypothetical protein GE061_005056 [Apolygus lucorum]